MVGCHPNDKKVKYDGIKSKTSSVTILTSVLNDAISALKSAFYKNQAPISEQNRSQIVSRMSLLRTILLIIISIHFKLAHADQVVLLDTTREATLEWTRYPYGPQAQTPGVRIICYCCSYFQFLFKKQTFVCS